MLARAASSGGGTRAREATRASGAASASAARRSSGNAPGGTGRSADVATAKGATARSATGAASTRASARTRASSDGTARVSGASTAKSPAVRQPLSAVPGFDSSAPSKLGAAVQMPEKFCACCRGPHRRGSAPLAPLSVTQRARAKRETCPPSEFARLYAKSALPAEKNSGAFGGADADAEARRRKSDGDGSGPMRGGAPTPPDASSGRMCAEERAESGGRADSWCGAAALPVLMLMLTC